MAADDGLLANRCLSQRLVRCSVTSGHPDSMHTFQPIEALPSGCSTTLVRNMRVTSLQLREFRSFVDMEPIDLGTITVLVGPNNAGKSSLIRGLYAMQEGPGSLARDIRIGSAEATVTMTMEGMTRMKRTGGAVVGGSGRVLITVGADGTPNLTMERSTPRGREHLNLARLPNVAPDHFIVPYLSKRKPLSYQEDVSVGRALAVTPQFDFLAAKLSRLSNPAFPSHARYTQACRAVLGFVVTSMPSGGGHLPGVYLTDTEFIPLSQMGDGVPNIVALLVELALSQDKLFLIEEPENDLHPKALKALLDLILDRAADNQFVVSTHSNIVVRHLGAADDSRLYSVRGEFGQMPPVASVSEVPPTPEARLAVLKDLGYSFSDLELWDGWLILEESSAERIIRDYLIPFFAPKLARVRTLAAGGNREVEPTFADFHRLVRFTHLEDAYKNRAWVLVDGDETGNEIVAALRTRYPTWQPDHFDCFDEPQFEQYYPPAFSDAVAALDDIDDRSSRRAAKALLLDQVRAWLDEDDERARESLRESAASVITMLTRIEASLFPVVSA